ncbi:MAG: RnfABCDGE type electron transport complex subunit B [Candidatus Omnitrophota bacterium]
MMEILISIITLGSLGLFFGLGLALASKKFCVKTDPRQEKVLDKLPGANCGACGQAGCMGLSESLIKGECTVDKCPVIKDEQRKDVADILGVEVKEKVKKIAVLHCNGGKKVRNRFIYDGIKDCNAANLIMGGQKACVFGCLEFGSCVKVCPFDAITMNEETGLPEVDESKCTACGKCAEICPKNLFKLIDVNKPVYVACSSHYKGKAVMEVCKVGCITCGKCEKQCPPGLFKIKDNLAEIDYNNYVDCDDCIKVCPTKVIKKRGA